MNRIYRRIWNAARQCWVVASELSSPRGKPAQTRLLMSALLLTTASGAFAANEADELAVASESRAGTLRVQKELIPLLSFAAPSSVTSAIAPRGRYDQLAIVMSGNYADARVSGADVLALGSRAQIYGTESTGVGNYAETSGGYATAIGHNARAYGGHGTALGTSSYAGSKGATALGHDARATAGNSIAIGSGASASYSESIAIGANSVASGSWTVSVGARGYERRITNVGNGISGTDAVNVNQLAAAESTANTARSVANSAQTTANTAKDTANTARSIAEATSKRINDTSVRLGSYSVADADFAVAVGYSATAGAKGVSVGRAAQSSLRSVALGENARATDTVTTALGNMAQATSMGATAAGYESKALGGLSTAIGGQAVAEHSRSVALGFGSRTYGDAQVSIGTASNPRKLVSLKDGLVAQGSAEAVTGSQLFSTDKAARDAEATAKSASSYATSAYSKVTVLEGLIRQESAGGSMRLGLQNTGSVLDVRNQSNAGRKIIGVLDGALTAASTDAVTGRQLFATDNTAKSASSYATSAYSKATALEGLIRQDAVAGSVRLGAENAGTVLDVRNKAGTNRKITGLAAGALGGSSAEAVTGAQLYATDQTAQRADTSAKVAVASANSALGKVAALEGLVMQVSPTGSLRLGAENTGTMLDVLNGSGGKRKIIGVADGAVANGSSEAITGNQLNATNGRVIAAQRDIANALTRLTDVEQSTRHIVIGQPLDDNKAQAGRLGVAIGDSAVAAPLGDGAVALGSYSRAMGNDSVALGRAAWVQDGANRGFALGSRSVVEEVAGLALGSSSMVKKGAINAVALGAGSVAAESNIVSFGDGPLQRRLINIARGTADHNATTVGQLNDTLATLGGGAKLDANGNVTSPTYIVQNTRQHTVGDALAILDGAVLRTTSRVDGMEGQLRSIFQDTASARADGFNQLTLAGAQGMVISNVANGLIAAGSREAVNGGQLHAVQQQLNGRIDGLEQRVDGRGPAPQSRAMALASTEQEAAAPTPPATQDDKGVADTGNAPKSSPASQPKAESPESPKPQVDTAELEKMLARANDYSDGIAREVDARLNKMDKRFNRMAAMSSAQTAMAMNTAGLATYNRLGAGVGYAEGESAMAVGYQRVLNDKGSATFSLNGAFTNSGERSVGVGVGIGW
ncbi:ESPR-type extended signal peptide-containing protein [Stenotrophomonas maltophilia]|uniref:ESPR-type extended signal peptide-containing protein n=1 Tax=Stenotrophomonas maltophilia TaxID=40324 RepID=UPI0009B264AC|nr:ESPR-type extended signal peptide-containing protein [Stenotrophomonas maltophilia]